MTDIAVVYYSLKGQTIAPGMRIVELERGHTAVAAEAVAGAVGGDLMEIVSARGYDPDHMVMIYEAKEEIDSGTRPELSSAPDVSGHGTVFLGYPNWWNVLPMRVVSYLEGRDWSGKRVIPFVTSGGSGFGRSLEQIRAICAGARVEDGATFLGHEVESSLDEIAEWARGCVSRGRILDGAPIVCGNHRHPGAIIRCGMSIWVRILIALKRMRASPSVRG